jgi:hypothetical protein
MNDFWDSDKRSDNNYMGDRTRRREDARRRVRRQRRIFAGVVIAVVVAVLVVFVVLPRAGGETNGGAKPGKDGREVVVQTPKASPSPTPSPSLSTAKPSPTASPTRSPKSTSSPSPVPKPTATETPKPTPTPTKVAVAPPRIVQDNVPYGDKRRREMATYCRGHYGAAQATWVLHPKAIVLHYTAGGTYSSAHNYFSNDTPNAGELPGVCAHFIIDKDGTIYQQLSTGVRCRHTVGLNYVAVGIEFVQESGSGDAWATGQILARPKQISSGLRLVAWLQARYGIPAANIYGHGTANSSRFYRDLKGWRNSHVDWSAPAIVKFKQRLAALR